MGMSGLVRRTNGIAAVVSTVALALFAATPQTRIAVGGPRGREF